nr:MAG TPA: hypothetical protein [Bacteriophage sp.]
MVISILTRITIYLTKISMRAMDRHSFLKRNYMIILSSITRL